MRRTAPLLMAIGALALPGAALAAPRLAAPIPGVRPAQAFLAPTMAPLDVTSDRAALGYYSSYLGTLLRQAPAGAIDNSTYIATISGSGGCRGALQPLAQSGGQLDYATRHTLSAVGAEMGDDLSISFDLAALTPFTRFAGEIGGLRWTRGSAGLQIVRRYVRSETRVLEMQQSGLCQDALLAAATPQTVPAGTTLFLKQYNRASRVANVALATLMRLMQAYTTPAEHGVVERIAVLARQIASLTRADLLHSGTLLTAALESSTTSKL